MRRTLTRLPEGDGWEVADEYVARKGIGDFSVRWQLAPGAWIKRTGERRFVLNRGGVSIHMEVDDAWTSVEAVEAGSDGAHKLDDELAGTVSPAFRKVEWAPFLKLVARPQPGRACVFRTTFLASPRS